MMIKGRLIVIDYIDSVSIAALINNGKLIDLFLPLSDTLPNSEAIYAAKAERPMKGQNGIILTLENQQKGFLKQAKGIIPGSQLLVQVLAHAQKGKASLVSQKIIFKSRYAIITPNVLGFNIARGIRDNNERKRLLDIIHRSNIVEYPSYGLILRSVAQGADETSIIADVENMITRATQVLSDTDGCSGLLFPAPDAKERAWREWVTPYPDQVIDETGSFESLGIWDHIETLKSPKVTLNDGAFMLIEPTSALVAVDINTGSDFSLSAGLKANLSAAMILPTELSLRGLGGQIIIDFAPCSKKYRKTIEQAMARAFKTAHCDTLLVGWTPLGNFELQRKRERRPLSDLSFNV